MPRDDEDRLWRRGPRDDYDDRPRRRPRRDDDEDDDRPRRPGRDQAEEDYSDEPPRGRRGRQVSTLGVCSLVMGVAGLSLSVIPCLGAAAILIALPGLVLGVLGYMLAKKSYGRQGTGLPIAGMATSAVAILISLGWIGFIAYTAYEDEKDMQRMEAEFAREEAEREAELAKAAGEVRAAAAGGAVPVTAGQFHRLWDDDEDQFDARYKNQVVELTGTVDEVDLDGDTYVVALKAGRQRTVDCNFARSPEVRARLARLQPGGTVRIRGKCLGGDPTLEACVLVE